MRPLHISLNTAHSGCKPSSFMSSFTHSPSLPASAHTSPSGHFHISTTSNHPHSYIPDARTILICHVSPPQPHSIPKRLYKTSLCFSCKNTPHINLTIIRSVMQIPNLHCPCLSQCQHTLNTSSVYLSFYVI